MDGTLSQRCISKFKNGVKYAYLLINKFIINRINSELNKAGRILTLFSVTEISCDDTSIASIKNPRNKF